MKTTNEHLLDMGACRDAREWADNYTTWEQIIGKCERSDWLLWLDTKMNILDDKERRLLAVHLVRTTPLPDGRTVYDLLTDERSRNALVVAERFAKGRATSEELAAAEAAARAADAAARAAGAAARAAAEDAARAAAWAAAWAAGAAARVAAEDAARAAGAAGDAAVDAAGVHQAKYIQRKYGKRIIATLNAKYRIK